MTEHQPPPIQPAPPQTPNYGEFSTARLQVEQTGQLFRLLGADFGHTVIQAMLFTDQLWAYLHGEADALDVSPDPYGINPKVDAREEDATMKWHAMHDELALRRSTRLAKRQAHR